MIMSCVRLDTHNNNNARQATILDATHIISLVYDICNKIYDNSPFGTEFKIAINNNQQIIFQRMW